MITFLPVVPKYTLFDYVLTHNAVFIMDDDHVSSFLVLDKTVNFTNMCRHVSIIIRSVDRNNVRQVCAVYRLLPRSTGGPITGKGNPI
jgi:hypothetical protein